MNIKPNVPIFLSSTKQDLSDYREKANSTIKKFSNAVKGMEVFGAQTEKSIEVCKKEVKESRIFVLIVGMRYGSIESNSGKSFVELEYSQAVESVKEANVSADKKEILVYIIDEKNARIAPECVDKNENAINLETFKSRLRKNHTIETFTSPDDLSIKLDRDLRRVLKELGIPVEENKINTSDKLEEKISILTKFDVMPKRIAWREIELEITFQGNASSISKEECTILGLSFGDSVKRQIISLGITDKFRFTEYLFATGSDCEFIYEAEKGKVYPIIARLAFGENRNPVIHESPDTSLSLIFKPTGLKDIDTGAYYENYTYTQVTPLKALIFVRHNI